MKTTVEKLSHSCGSRDGLQVWQDEHGNFDGYCFSCKKFVPNPYEDGKAPDPSAIHKKTAEQIEEEMQEVASYPSRNLPTRRLKAEYLEYFGVKVGVSQVDGETPETVYFPYGDEEGNLIGYKVRLLDPKRMWAVGTTRNSAPFGWEQAKRADGAKLFITEGEFDTIALFQLLKDKNKGTQYADRNIPVISLPAGVDSVNKCLSKYRAEIEKHFKEIVLVFDNDDPGQKAIEEALKIFPTAKVVTLPEKDLNDCIIKGRSKLAHDALVFRAVTQKNTRIINGKTLHEKSKKPAEWGLPWPFPGINDATRGIRTGETIYLGAGKIITCPL